MSETYSTALLIFLVGMVTIFLVLSLVVFSGNMLIRIVNSLHKEDQKGVRSPAKKNTSPFSNEEKETIERKKLAAIVGAVDIFTQGKGRINSIDKVE